MIEHITIHSSLSTELENVGVKVLVKTIVHIKGFA